MSLLILTRYLYVKEEVEVAILSSMLELNSNAIFWAYELYYSGFQQETFELLFKIYYFLFASLNPDVEAFLHEKYNQWLTSNKKDAYVINDILQTLLIRPYDTDVLLLHRLATYLDYDADISSTECNTDAAAHFVANPTSSSISVFPSLNPIVALSRHIAAQNKNERCPPLYMKTKPADADQYETRTISPPYMTLRTVCIPVDPHHYLALFGTPRKDSPIAMQIYHQCWLACASYSPIWMARIEAHGGSRTANNKMVFAKEEDEESFYEKYGYEPDEQPMEVQRRNIPPIIEGKTWGQIVRKGVFPANEWESDLIGNL
jgi:hypothetical protein